MTDGDGTGSVNGSMVEPYMASGYHSPEALDNTRQNTLQESGRGNRAFEPVYQGLGPWAKTLQEDSENQYLPAGIEKDN